jgi:ubiquinone/menaquinone biosynthesis C-methylase UbiE
MDRHKLFGFTNVDQAPEPEYFIRFLDAAAAEESFQAYKRRCHDLLEPRPGKRLLELGCGTGDDAQALARRGAPGGQVVALDSSRTMIAEARKRTAGSGLPIEFQVADAHHLDFADHTFDGCLCDRTFMHLDDPLGVLREMVRVAKSGAVVVVFEVDFETIVIDVPDHALARKVLHSYTDSFRNGWLGRRIPALFREAGLQELTILPYALRLTYTLALQVAGPATVDRARAAGVLSEAEAETWLQQLQAAEAAGRFFSTLSGFLVSGRKP